ncbi:2-hydroxychromene-2-carboxylate isomerase [compost metagenome]
MPLAFNPHFPINTLQLMRGAVGYLGSEQFQPYVKAVFEALWVQQQNLGNAEVVAKVLSAAGFDPAEFEQRVGAEAVKQRLKDNTEEALRRGVFGAPTFFVGNQMFFGQDRLDFVAEALAQQA